MQMLPQSPSDLTSAHANDCLVIVIVTFTTMQLHLVSLTISSNIAILLRLAFLSNMETRHGISKSCHSAGWVTAKILLTCLAASSTFRTTAAASWNIEWRKSVDQLPIFPIIPSTPSEPEVPTASSPGEHDFTLRHIFEYGTRTNPNLYRWRDIRPEDIVWAASEEGSEKSRLGPLHAKSKKTTIERLSDRRVSKMQALYREARITGTSSSLDASEWILDEVSGPNTTDKETVVSLAKMSWNAYTAEPGTGEWQDETGKFNHSQSFGWEGDSLRGHVFADKDNSTIIIAIKGTTRKSSLSLFCTDFRVTGHVQVWLNLASWLSMSRYYALYSAFIWRC